MSGNGSYTNSSTRKRPSNSSTGMYGGYGRSARYNSDGPNRSRGGYSNSRGFGGGRSRGGPKKQGRGQYIHPSKFIREATPVKQEDYTPTHKFSDFNILDILKDNLEANGYFVPSPVQDQTIPLGLEGKDVIGIANTGTGKTVAFGIPVLNKLINDRMSKALIIAPTRELCLQINEYF